MHAKDRPRSWNAGRRAGPELDHIDPFWRLWLQVMKIDTDFRGAEPLLHEQAIQATGLSDFGPYGEYRDGLQALLDAIERLMKGRTTFIIAHRLSTLRSANRILVLDHGEIVEQGVHSELMERGGLYESLYRQQIEFAGAQSSRGSE